MDMFLNCHFSNQSIQKAAIAQAFMAVSGTMNLMELFQKQMSIDCNQSLYTT